ncbi:hypothetical protein [Agrococcus sp. SGAir0287]|uniref:hypothetical protein n=1 Tax=Agrococcus sp. SGAir0287 TaxID=2070347 RepID=UPI0010CCB45A|nr:hypothetical protein [Agrococcus sp. SGAir0287]QCR19965.1 hypothetical protein C1N71_11405 [Agrococcus sp. SGAir0287]
MTEHARSAERERLAAVLEALRVEPTADLRVQRAEARWRVLRGDDVALRMLFAEHYRAIGALDQAARFGVVEPGWMRPRELRALRRVLLREVAGGSVRDLLGLGRRARVPSEVADLIEIPERAVARGSGLARAFATIASFGGVLWFVVVVARAVVAATQGVEVLDALRAVRVEAFVAGVVGLAGTMWLRRHPRPRGDWLRRRDIDAERRAQALLPTLELHTERHALLRGWLASSWMPDHDARVRRLLVDLARERRRPAEAGRWGIAIDGVTTPDERARFAVTLHAGDEWMRELERRTERKPGRLGVDERDTLIRAGVAPEAIDRRWMTNDDRLTEIEHERVARVLAELLEHPTDALRHERAAIVRAASKAPHPEVRRLLAEHYRALGEHAQAGRWGLADDDWATEVELRALRLDLLEQRPTQPTRAYLGLARHDRLPKAVADIERTGERPEHPLAMVGGAIGLVGLLALVVGVLLLPVAVTLALLGIEQPGWLWPTIAGCGATTVVGGLAAVGGLVLGDHLEARVSRRDAYARELRRRLPGLADPAERRSLPLGALESRELRTRRAARRVLVDASRRLGRADEVARWGASIEGETTADEREALAARLARTRDPMRTYVARSHREPGPLGVDELDVLRRAGVPVEAMDGS